MILIAYNAALKLTTFIDVKSSLDLQDFVCYVKDNFYSDTIN